MAGFKRITPKDIEDVNRLVSKLPGVQGAVTTVARRVYIQANARLSAHHTEHPRSRILYERDFPIRQDRLISLYDPDGGALAIEFGHYTRPAKNARYIAWHIRRYGSPPQRTWVEGLNIIKGLG